MTVEIDMLSSFSRSADNVIHKHRAFMLDDNKDPENNGRTRPRNKANPGAGCASSLDGRPAVKPGSPSPRLDNGRSAYNQTLPI
jgi:hypothetical protein